MNKIYWLILCFLPLLQIHAQEDDLEELLSTGRILNLADQPDENGRPRRLIRRVGSLQAAALPNIGSPNVPVVLVEFPDRPFEVSGSNSEEVKKTFDVFFNAESNAEVQQKVGSNGSVRSYFIAQSDSLLRPNFSIIGPVRVKESYAYYGKNSGSNKQVNITQFYREALDKSVRDFSIDWSTFDNDGDGRVDMVFFIYAGWGENSVSQYDPDAIWAHEMPAQTTVSMDDGTQIRFACMGVSPEARYKSLSQINIDKKDPRFAPTGYNPANLRIDGIGTSVHELSHALGLPDIYDTRPSDRNMGLDVWSVMDYGCYSWGGRFPCGYTAYERDFMQWKPLVELEEPAIVEIPAGDCTGYKIINDANPNEYYIVENRQAYGWDDYTCTVYDNGLQVTHVEFDNSAWTSNRVNSVAGHPRLCLVPANNVYIFAANAKSAEEYNNALSGNLFPYNATYQDLTDDTTPASAVYTGGFLHKPLRNITQDKAGNVTFLFRTNGKLETPEVFEPSEMESDHFTASWLSVENATRYAFQLYHDDLLVRTDTLEECSNLIPYPLIMMEDYKYRVQALSNSPEDYLPSEWSEFVYLREIVTDISDLSNSAYAEVYALDGTKFGTLTESQMQRLHPQQHILIRRYANGAVRKVMMR